MKECKESRGRISFSIKEGVGYLELDNPKARNAMSINMMASLPIIISEIAASEIVILVIRGTSIPFFCAGGDLKDVRERLATPEKGREMCSWMTTHLQDLSDLPIYIIVVIEGAAIGGGAELMTLGDWIIVSESAQIGFVQVSLGVTTGWGGAKRLIERVGKRKAGQILLSSKRYSAKQAMEIGLVDQISDDIEATLQEHLSTRKKLPRRSLFYAISMMKGLCREEEAFAATWGSVEHCIALGLSKKDTK